MKYLQLLPCTLRDEIIVQVIFDYDQDLINRVRLIEGAQWSASLKTWYFNRRAFNLNSFFKKFKGIAFVDYSKLNPTPLVSEPNSTIFKAQQPNIQLPSSYQELLELKRYSPNTIKTYVSEFKKFCSFYAAQDINALTQDDIKRYLLSIIQKQKVSASSQNQAINAIKFYYEKVLQLSKMVFTIQRPRKEKLLPKVLSKEEVFAIISSIQNLKHRSIIALIYSAGLRRSELLNLKIQDIDAARNLLIIRGGKGNKDRQTIISIRLIEDLRVYYKEYKPKVWLFEGPNGKQYSATSIVKILARSVKRIKINKHVSPHMLRHSFATHLLEQGVSLRHIQKLLGHNSSKTTEIYTQVSTQEISKIKNPLDGFYKNKSGTIQTNTGSIVPLKVEYKRNINH